MKAALLMILGLVGGMAGVARAQDANALVGRSSRVYRSLSSLKADFVQVIDNPMIDSAESRSSSTGGRSGCIPPAPRPAR